MGTSSEMTLRKDGLFHKWCWENWISTRRRLKLDPCPLHCIKINSKRIKDLTVRPETSKLLQERIRNTLEHIGKGNNFLTRTPMAQ
jgi:hypothetical protein